MDKAGLKVLRYQPTREKTSGKFHDSKKEETTSLSSTQSSVRPPVVMVSEGGCLVQKAVPTFRKVRKRRQVPRSRLGERPPQRMNQKFRALKRATKQWSSAEVKPISHAKDSGRSKSGKGALAPSQQKASERTGMVETRPATSKLHENISLNCNFSSLNENTPLPGTPSPPYSTSPSDVSPVSSEVPANPRASWPQEKQLEENPKKSYKKADKKRQGNSLTKRLMSTSVGRAGWKPSLKQRGTQRERKDQTLNFCTNYIIKLKTAESSSILLLPIHVLALLVLVGYLVLGAAVLLKVEGGRRRVGEQRQQARAATEDISEKLLNVSLKVVLEESRDAILGTIYTSDKLQAALRAFSTAQREQKQQLCLLPTFSWVT